MSQSILKKQFNAFEKYCDGVLGVDALHLETGEAIKYNPNEKFLMCSTYKLPMAIYLLQQIESGSIKITDNIEITEYDLRPGVAGTLNQLSYSTPLSLSIENLLRLMMQESCNTSTDIILRMIGGPSAVTTFLQKLGITDMRVDRYTLDAIARWDGITQLPIDHRITPTQYKKLEQSVSQADLSKAKNEFKNTIEDTTTPSSMTQLIEKLFNGQLLKREYTELLLNVMRGCKRGPMRLMGLLPKNTVVAHKTGTLTGYTCDVGVVTLPHGVGHFAISVYIKNSSKDLNSNERMIAEIGRMLYDYYLLR